MRKCPEALSSTVRNLLRDLKQMLLFEAQTHPFKIFFIRQMSRFLLHFYTTANSNTTNVSRSSEATAKMLEEP